MHLYADGVSRGVGFVIESCGGAEGTVIIEGKQNYFRPLLRLLGGKSRWHWYRIGGVELSNDGADGLVLGESQRSGGIEIGGDGV